MYHQQYDIPCDINGLFQESETTYYIIDYDPSKEMDNNQSMQYFLELVGISDLFIEANNGTQVILTHPEYGQKLVIDASGLGDFFSHKFDVAIVEEPEITCCVCNIKKGKEVCNNCNTIYSKTIGATFDTKEDIEHFFGSEDIPRYKLRNLSNEMNSYLD